MVAVTVQTTDGGDTASLPNTLDEAERQLAGTEVEEVVADKGYHSNETMKGLQRRGLRSYISEPARGRRKWKRDREAQEATYANRRRIRGDRGKWLLRRRGEKLGRGFAHLPGTGGLRRVHVRGQEEIRKRLLIHAAAFNLGLLMRKHCGFGKPRALQGFARAQAVLASHARAAGARIFCFFRPHTGLFLAFGGAFRPFRSNIGFSSCPTRNWHKSAAVTRLEARRTCLFRGLLDVADVAERAVGEPGRTDDDRTLGGYIAVHSRPPAFEVCDGQPSHGPAAPERSRSAQGCRARSFARRAALSAACGATLPTPSAAAFARRSTGS